MYLGVDGCYKWAFLSWPYHTLPIMLTSMDINKYTFMPEIEMFYTSIQKIGGEKACRGLGDS